MEKYKIVIVQQMGAPLASGYLKNKMKIAFQNKIPKNECVEF